jgi:hypothetical protein
MLVLAVSLMFFCLFGVAQHQSKIRSIVMSTPEIEKKYSATEYKIDKT